jgi:hypothetical protein
VTADGFDVVLGGSGDDGIDAGTDGSRDVVVGDHGYAFFDVVGSESLLREIGTSNAYYGGVDTIVTADGFDVVLGGTGDDDINAGTDGSRDVVFGDNGYARFDANEVLIEVASTDGGPRW